MQLHLTPFYIPMLKDPIIRALDHLHNLPVPATSAVTLMTFKKALTDALSNSDKNRLIILEQNGGKKQEDGTFSWEDENAKSEANKAFTKYLLDNPVDIAVLPMPVEILGTAPIAPAILETLVSFGIFSV